jgi:hypothetical protein
MPEAGFFSSEGLESMTTAEAPANDQAKPPARYDAIHVRMSPELLDAIGEAAKQRGMTSSAWLRSAATTFARLEGTLPTPISRTAGELYDRDTEGRQRWARIEGDQIKSIGYHVEKPDDGVYVPVVHEDSEPFDTTWHWRLKPEYAFIDVDGTPDRVICTYPVVAKSWEHA